MCNWLVSEFNPPQMGRGDRANSKYIIKYSEWCLSCIDERGTIPDTSHLTEWFFFVRDFSHIILFNFVFVRWRKFWYGTEVITLPKTADLDADVVTLCDQFKRYHKQNCQRSVVSDLRYVYT